MRFVNSTFPDSLSTWIEPQEPEFVPLTPTVENLRSTRFILGPESVACHARDFGYRVAWPFRCPHCKSPVARITLGGETLIFAVYRDFDCWLVDAVLGDHDCGGGLK